MLQRLRVGVLAGLKPCARSVFIYCYATSPAARSSPGARPARSAAGVWRCTASVSRLTSSRCRCPSCACLRSPNQLLKARLLQFAVALQQQRLQVVTGVRPAEPPEHPRLVGFNRHHAFIPVRLRLWPVIGGLPLQHAQRALLLSCVLGRLNRWSLWWCLSRCWCLRVCLRRLKWRRIWLALWSSRLSRHVLLRFDLAPRGPAPPFRFRRSVVPAQRAPPPLAPPPLAPAPLVRSAPFNYMWSRYNTKDKDDPQSRTTLPSRSVRRKRMCLRVTGPLRAIKCPSSEPVSTMVPTPLFSVILERMLSPRLPALCWRWPAGRSAGRPCCAPSSGRTRKPAARRRRSSGSMWSTLKGLVGEAGGAAGSAASGNCCRSSRSFRISRLPS